MASNFASTARILAKDFEDLSGHRVTLVSGSTGKHYAQIRAGAPFDVFLAADEARPRLLEGEGRIVAGTRFTYALGRLVLWSAVGGLVDSEVPLLERPDRFSFLAIANPTLAPYGRAAREVLEAWGIWSSLEGKIVQGENVAQAFQFVKSGNAEVGLVAWSQVKELGDSLPGSYRVVPRDLYAPIEQQAVLLRDTRAGRKFVEYLQSPSVRQLIQSHGYLAAR